MERKLFYILSILVLVISGILVTTTVASAETGSQTWLLNSSDHPDYSSEKLMEKVGVTTPTGSVSIATSQKVIWLSQNDAECDVTFTTDGGWGVTLITQEDWGDAYTIEVGVYNPGGSPKFTPFDDTVITNDTFTFMTTHFVFHATVLNTNATVLSGQYLALQIGNTSGSSHTVITTGGSLIVSPTTDPGYPLPELVTAILLGGGLLGLGGYFTLLYRRNRLTDMRGVSMEVEL